MRLPREASPSVGRPFIDLDYEIYATVLQIVREGWAHAREFPDINVGAVEVPMTKRLLDGMRSAVNRSKAGWGRGIIV